MDQNPGDLVSLDPDFRQHSNVYTNLQKWRRGVLQKYIQPGCPYFSVKMNELNVLNPFGHSK